MYFCATPLELFNATFNKLPITVYGLKASAFDIIKIASL